MSQATIEYNGGIYLSQPYTVSILAPLLASAGRLLGFDLPRVVAQQNPELAALIASAPLMQFESRKAARAELVEILNELFPLLPALEYVQDMQQFLTGLNTITEGLQQKPSDVVKVEQLAEAVAPIVESSLAPVPPTPPALTPLPIDDRYAEMAGLFEPV